MPAETKAATKSYKRNSAVNTLQTIETPAANVRGIRITSISMYISTAGDFFLIGKQSAPSAANEAGDGVIGVAAVNAGATLLMAVALPVVIPPGYGLYEWPDTANSSRCWIGYELL